MKFRRKVTEDPLDDDLVTDLDGDEAGAATGAGPIDAEDLDSTDGRVDLGALLLLPVEGTELQLQVDEASGAVQSVMFAGPEGALELKVFAAPRNGDLWNEVRPQIAADLGKRGGTATEREGRFGTELVCQMPVTLPDGQPGLQPSRVIGINGSRWLLRATLLGRPAVEPDAGTAFEDALTTVAVRRGAHAMPVGDPLALSLPPDARRNG
ncbi:DUF3710 domain-containing protein [Nocardioides islandensis]|uniref:DUF3710 domain-containing protein n=1 Tax=Nocardioides islandensis TaxID=433663 RepID=UPI002B27873F|nr:DUF3710 domain-containing protein [Nocardioides islandensis]